MIPIPTYAGRRVAVFGLGRTGITAARALEASGAEAICWDDSEASRARASEAGLKLEDLNRRDWGDIAALVLSPGIPLTHPKPHRVVTLAQAVGAPVIGDMELFAQALSDPSLARRPKIVGITGTNGKSTTTALLGHILKESGRRVVVAGNIGDAILAQDAPRPGSHYVLELSSYQIDLTRSLDCDIAMLLNISPDHIDRHGDFDGYFRAKQRLFDMQNTRQQAIIGVDDAETEAYFNRLRGARAPGLVLPVSTRRVFSQGVYAAGGSLYEAFDGSAVRVADLSQARALPGRHNAQNAAAALAAARLLGVSARDAAAGLLTFPGLAHRQEVVGERDGVRFVNDSKATNAQAALQALNSYPEIYWIAGGRAKDDGVKDLLSALGAVRKTYLIGEAQERFARELDGKVEIARCGDLEAATAQAARDAAAAGSGKAVVLLSPAAASFDQFASFEARGDAFRDIVTAMISTSAEETA